MRNTLMQKIVLGALAIVPIGLFVSIVILMFTSSNLDLVPLVRVFIWLLPLPPLLAVYFVWITTRSNFSTEKKVAWIAALLLWSPISNIVFWIVVIRKSEAMKVE